jgi:hypothetical protein
MTLPVDSATHCKCDDSLENCEIEITPEMIESGLDSMWDYESYIFEDKRRAALVNIYSAMEKRAVDVRPEIQYPLSSLPYLSD